MNVKYVTTAGSGAFTVVNNPGEDNAIYFQNKDDVTFTAYYPYDGENGTAPGTNGIISKSITAAEQTADGRRSSTTSSPLPPPARRTPT